MTARVARVALRALDVSLAGAAALAGAGVLVARRRGRGGAPAPAEPPRLMAIDSMYSLGMLRSREAVHLVTHRDLDGYFEHVWSVNPFVGVDPTQPAAEAVGSPTVSRLAAAHTMIEGRSGRLRSLNRLPYLNFVLAQVQLLLALDRIVDRRHVCVIRGDPYYHGLLALLLGRLNGRRVELRIIANFDAIYDAVGTLAFPRLFPSKALERRVARYTLSRADSVVICSQDNRAFALRNGARAERLAHAPNSTMVNPLHLEEPAAREALDDEFGLGDRPVVVCVSRLAHMKHPEDVVVSLAKARRTHPRLAAVLVGTGPLRGELEELCLELGVSEHVVFAGDRDQRWIARMLTQAAVIAVPLAGLALVEAALSGTPIVAYDVEWHAEFLANGREGLLVPYRDTDAMAAAICSVVEDPALGADLAAAARRHALQVMDPAKLLAHERALADALLARSPVPGAA